MPKKGDIVYFIFPYPDWFDLAGLIEEKKITCEPKCCWVIELDEDYISLLPFNTYKTKHFTKKGKRFQKVVKTAIGFTQEHRFVINKSFVFKDSPRQTELDLRNLLKIPYSCYKTLKKRKEKDLKIERKTDKNCNFFQDWYKKRLKKRSYKPNILNPSCFEKINKKCKIKTI